MKDTSEMDSGLMEILKLAKYNLKPEQAKYILERILETVNPNLILQCLRTGIFHERKLIDKSTWVTLQTIIAGFIKKDNTLRMMPMDVYRYIFFQLCV